ncbi:hypothetical protein MVLG_03499 [Microbotryum lychnidis-dioicae p1A1 Lamole]|uniref:Flavin reductase like domain-containing protein n=1 Tax=Microbotryum lychnidis-dioicae (strain p1A1 Lamole / MvSl-1064) TaxID=683840 RepID=U5H8D7_USTV1|nr:hypothetical protein MVLG_03499 [Microbotryum lychnidis-dioicae p1A1 Lamole]|eukprot:KDE06221.1 hypothetical protein MVLG_03499 [Microbotryum lychnidis-dioicae p1A1 Lamole]
MRPTVTVCRFCSAITRSYSVSNTSALLSDASTSLRHAMRSVAQPVAVVTIPLDPTRPNVDTHGATLSSLSSISLSPPIVAFSLRLPSKLATYLMDSNGGSSSRSKDGTVRPSKTMRIHLLSHQQEDLARIFAGQPLLVDETLSKGKQGTRREGGVATSAEFEPRWFESLRGASLGTLECRLIKSLSLRMLEEDVEGEEVEGEGRRGRDSSEEEDSAPRSQLFLAKVVHVELPNEGEGGRFHKSLVYKGQGYHHV